jgi:hypothetical protein
LRQTVPLYLICTLGCITHRTYRTHRISKSKNLHKMSGFEEWRAVRVLLAEQKPLVNTGGFLLLDEDCTLDVPFSLFFSSSTRCRSFKTFEIGLLYSSLPDDFSSRGHVPQGRRTFSCNRPARPKPTAIGYLPSAAELLSPRGLLMPKEGGGGPASVPRPSTPRCYGNRGLQEPTRID